MILSPPSFWEGKENVKSLKKGSMLANANKYYVEIIKEKKKDGEILCATVAFARLQHVVVVVPVGKRESQPSDSDPVCIEKRECIAVVAFYRGYQPLLYFVNSVRVESKELSLRVHVRSARLRRIRARTSKIKGEQRDSRPSPYSGAQPLYWQFYRR
jgi:hypothetical protein